MYQGRGSRRWVRGYWYACERKQREGRVLCSYLRCGCFENRVRREGELEWCSIYMVEKMDGAVGKKASSAG